MDQTGSQYWVDFFIGNERRPISVWTLLHLVIGIIVALLRIPFLIFLLLQIAFELIENSIIGINISEWMGNKIQSLSGITLWEVYQGDSLANSICDVLAGSLGWLIGSLIRKD